MMTREPAREPARRESIREPRPEQPMLPFEEAAPASGDDEPTGPETKPGEVWEALPQATRAEVRRGCLRAMREVVGDAPR